ncbi:DUF982 domain-containing protein [Rhizobium leguminosarum]|nr:DUF982 domain-containing protein [Rhizobium leguminosarum]
MTSQKQIEGTWSEPVFVQVGMNAPEAVGGASEALEFLANRWKGSRRKHAFAREICAAAVSRHVSQETCLPWLQVLLGRDADPGQSARFLPVIIARTRFSLCSMLARRTPAM